MHNLIAIHPLYRAEILDHDAGLLFNESDFLVLEGVDVTLILRCLIEGDQTTNAIAHRLKGVVPESQVQAILAQMKQDGLLTDSPANLSPSLALISSVLNVGATQVTEALRRKQVGVSAYGIDPALFQSVLAQWEIRTDDEGDVIVVLTDDYLHPGLEAFNRSALRTGRPWLLICPVGREPYLGPLFLPGKTACWSCLARRLRHNRRAERFLHHKQGRSFSEPASEPLNPLMGAVLHMAVWELLKWLVLGSNERLENCLVSLSTATWMPESHVVSRLGTCAACGTGQKPSARPLSPLVLCSHPKRFTSDGGHRSLEPDAAFARYQHLVDPLTGVLRNLKRLKGSSEDLTHTFTVNHSLIARLDTLDKLRLDIQAGSSGKGKTEAQARASALFEGLERYSSVWQGTEYRVMDSYHNLKPAALHPHDLLGFSHRQYAARAAWNATCANQELHVPDPYDDARTIEWAPVWSLTRNILRYMPAAYGYLGYPCNEAPICYGDSNGNAAGITLEEAILQGFFELVERDATAIWFYNRLCRPGVDLESFGDPYFDDLRQHYRYKLHRELWVLDVTTDLGIPSVVAVSPRTDHRPEHIALGFGCHLDPRIAVGRALTEVNQVLHLVPSETRDDALAASTSPSATWFQTATLHEHPYLAPAPDLPPRTLDDYGRIWSDDLLEDVRTCVRLAEEVGHEVCVLNLTHEDIDLPVVKVVAPGLVHYWRRLGHRRLYEVPVRMGWREQPLREESMNPFSIVL